jgi:hypothetical protein
MKRRLFDDPLKGGRSYGFSRFAALLLLSGIQEGQAFFVSFFPLRERKKTILLDSPIFGRNYYGFYLEEL